MIPYYRLSKNNHDLKALEQVYLNGNWAIGNETNELEKLLGKIFKKKYIVFTSNGYSALFVSIKCLKLKNEKIILPAISTCFAMSNAIISTGNIPVFCDVNLEDGNCNIESVRQIVNDQNVNYLISPNHAGNISAISAFKKMGLTVIEDACQSCFSSFEIASEADIQVFSFYPTKGINGIDGGVIATNNDEIAHKAKKLIYYNDQEEFAMDERYNFRFLNICAAMALSSIGHYEATINKLKSINIFYNNTIKNFDYISVLQNKISSILQRYVIYINDSFTEKILVELFKVNQIQLNKFFIWICPEKEKSNFIKSNKLIQLSYCIPYYEDLKEDELLKIESVLNDVITKSNNK